MANIVLVTGAAGALGSIVVRRLAAGGARVAAVDTPRGAERLAALAKDVGEGCLPVPLDVTDAAAWKEALGRIENDLGALEGAALVAGGFSWTGPLHAADDDAWDEMMQINAKTVERSLRALLPGMVARGRGSVVVIGARPGDRPWMGAGMAAYTASKAAVMALARTVAAEVLEQGVRVNVVMPSVIDTPRNRADMPDADPSRWVTPESIAGVIAFLLSDAAQDVSGALVPVYGRS